MIATLGDGLAATAEETGATDGFSALFSAMSRGETALKVDLPAAEPGTLPPLELPQLPGTMLASGLAATALLPSTGKVLQAAGQTGKILPLPRLPQQPKLPAAALATTLPTALAVTSEASEVALEEPAERKPREAATGELATAPQDQPQPVIASPLFAMPVTALTVQVVADGSHPAASHSLSRSATQTTPQALAQTAPAIPSASPPAALPVASAMLLPQTPAGALGVSVTMAAQPVASLPPRAMNAQRASDTAPMAAAVAPVLPTQIDPAAPVQQPQVQPAPALASSVPLAAPAAPVLEADGKSARIKGVKPTAPETPRPLASSPETAPLATALPASLASAPVMSASAAHSVAPAQDLARIVDQLAAAREALAPASAAMTIEHAEFGALSLRFDQRGDGGLAVQLAASNPEAQRAVSAAMGADAGQFMGQDGQPQGNPQQALPQQTQSQSQSQPQQGSAAAYSSTPDRDPRGAGTGQRQDQPQQQAGRQQPSGQGSRQPSSTPDQSPRDGVFA
ncbi:MAG: hypothetical protein RLZZ08_196 [Pseudomonadota bacterium]